VDGLVEVWSVPVENSVENLVDRSSCPSGVTCR
jgi:hypothetical protein